MNGLEKLYSVRKVKSNEVVRDFDCGDADLNDFIKNSATKFNRFRREQGVPNSKRLRSYPAIKVCRLGVDLSARNVGSGTMILNFVKSRFSTNPESGCRFVTVDAYIDAIPFYEKNGFHLLDDKEIDKSDFTRIMYFDLKRIS